MEDRTVNRKAKNTSESIRKEFEEQYGDKYDFSRVVFAGYKTKIEVVCPQHGVFWKSIGNMRKGGCLKCSKQAKRDRDYSNRRFNTQQVRDLFEYVHGTKYTYPYLEEEYRGMKKNITVVCPTHGETRQTPTNHIKAHGCAKCFLKTKSDSLQLTQEEFVEKSKNVHGDAYDYSLADYTGHRNKVKIVCPTHGEFIQMAGSHMNGIGCPECSNRGFIPTRPGWLYVLYDGAYVKVGITGRDVEDRVKEVNRHSIHKFKEVYSRYFESGYDCRNKEQEVLKEIRTLYKNPVEKFSGWYETFVDTDLAGIINMCHED